jgi:hypothetical protein
VKALAPAILAVVLFEGGCSSSSSTSQCAGGATSTLTVTVENTSIETTDICNATVKTSGPSRITLERTGNTTSCTYVGTVSPGTYEVTATAPAYGTGSSRIVIQTGCPGATSIDLMQAP